jgi:hypothetical protein
MSRREKKKLSKAEREARRTRRDAQELAALVKDTAATFRSAFETADDCAAECAGRRADLLADLDYRRLSHDVWQGRPGAEALTAGITDLITENERHVAAMVDLLRRFKVLGSRSGDDIILDAAAVQDDFVRSRLFPPQA